VVPTNILAELVILGNGQKRHQTLIGFRPFGFNEFVVGRPVDQLWTATIGTKTGIIEITFCLGRFVGRGFHGRNTRGGAVVGVGPDAVLVVGMAAVVGD
jgi:hypothetical protein